MTNRCTDSETSFSPEVGKVLDNSPASINDIREGDIIARINNINIKKFTDIAQAIRDTKKINIDIVRDNKLLTKEFNLNYNQEMRKYIIGITSTNNPIINKDNSNSLLQEQLKRQQLSLQQVSQLRRITQKAPQGPVQSQVLSH